MLLIGLSMHKIKGVFTRISQFAGKWIFFVHYFRLRIINGTKKRNVLIY